MQNQSKRFFDKPAMTISYQGETDHTVGPVHNSGDSPSVTTRYLAPYFLLDCRLNTPDDFWRQHVAEVGVVRWRCCPWNNTKYWQTFPDPEIAAMFPDYRLGRFTDDWEVEVQGDRPDLVATSRNVLPKKDLGKYGDEIILWQGTAPELTKAVWFELIFPWIYPTERSGIAQFLVRKGVEIPPHPPIPNTVYLYRMSTWDWQVRLDRTYETTQFWTGECWGDRETQAKKYYTEQDAQAEVDRING